MLSALVIQKRMSLPLTTLVGHSLGSHLSGLIAEKFRISIFGKIAVIVALDPAGVKYRKIQSKRRKDKYRLHKGSADYILVIHSSSFGLGWEQPLGDADFYPNYGYLQPCCFITFIPNYLTNYSKCRQISPFPPFSL